MYISSSTGSIIKSFGIKEGYRILREAGFEAIDWNLQLDWNIGALQKATSFEGMCVFDQPVPPDSELFAEELAIIRENGLVIGQAHSMAPAYVPGRRDIMDYSIRVYNNLIHFLDAVGCQSLIIHGINMDVKETDMSLEDYYNTNLYLYESLFPSLRDTKNIKVCIENVHYNCNGRGHGYLYGSCADPSEIVTLVDTLNERFGDKRFGLCLDVGHMTLLCGNPRFYLPTIGDRVIALHIHDNCQESDRHLMPYTGYTDWEELCRELKAVGYKGNVNFECHSQITPHRLPQELVPAFMRALARIGVYFRDLMEA